MSQTEEWTIGRLLRWTTDYLQQHGVETPRLDAEILLAEARGCARIELYTAYDQIANQQTRNVFRNLVHRRAAGTPVAYLVGRREFYSLNFQVNPDVLIPRPETELLVMALLDKIRHAPPAGMSTIADVGTGSGIIAVCAAKYCTNCRVTATDISRNALEVAAANVQAHGVADRVVLVESDLMDALPEHHTFDYIVSNAPYVKEAEYASLPREIREHEPRQALVAGPRGTEIIQRLVGQAEMRLKPGGWLLVEIAPGMVEPVTAEIDCRREFEPVQLIKDLAGLARVLHARRIGAEMARESRE
jgi:release factor glutamine methyltransferase